MTRWSVCGSRGLEAQSALHNLLGTLPPGRQGYTTFQHENIIAEAIHLVGEENVMWGSDYPHPDGVWPDSRKIIQQDLGRLEAKVRRKITCENARKLYGLMT